jgi:hypothetical protein
LIALQAHALHDFAHRDRASLHGRSALKSLALPLDAGQFRVAGQGYKKLSGRSPFFSGVDCTLIACCRRLDGMDAAHGWIAQKGIPYA